MFYFLKNYKCSFLSCQVFVDFWHWNKTIINVLLYWNLFSRTNHIIAHLILWHNQDFHLQNKNWIKFNFLNLKLDSSLQMHDKIQMVLRIDYFSIFTLKCMNEQFFLYLFCTFLQDSMSEYFMKPFAEPMNFFFIFNIFSQIIKKIVIWWSFYEDFFF